MSTRRRIWPFALLVLALFAVATVPAWALRRNVASQTICAQLLTTAVAAHTSGTTTVYYTLDGGTQAGHADGSVAVSEGNGLWCYAPPQAATNGAHAAYTFVNAGAVPVSVQTYTDEPQTGDGYAYVAGHLNGSLGAGTHTAQTGDGYGYLSGHLSGSINGTLAAGSHVAQTGDSYGYLGSHLNGSIASGSHVAQSGDSYARIGAPAGASVSADVAAVKVDTAAILTDTGTTLDGRIPAALVGGRMDTSVGAMAANVLTATAINADALTAAKLAADVTTELQAGLATPTNITAGTITTVTNLTNLPAAAATAADLALIPHSNGSATWNATALAAITTAATAATPTAAAVTGAVGSVTGNVGGSVASVTGAVGSVTGLTTTTIADQVWDENITTHTNGSSTGAALAAATAPSAATVATAVWSEAARTLTSGAAPSVADIADGVWDEATAGHAVAGSTGAALSAAGSAGDPWITALPGAYAAGSAGYKFGLLALESTVLGQFGVTWGATYPLVRRDGVINVPRGDVYTISTTLGADFPLTGRTVYFIGQKTKATTNTTAIVNRAMTITSVANRTCTITLTAAETLTAGQYLYEIEVRDTTTEANPSTAEAGTLNIIDDLRK